MREGFKALKNQPPSSEKKYEAGFLILIFLNWDFGKLLVVYFWWTDISNSRTKPAVHLNRVKEEIMSLNSLRRITLKSYVMIPSGFFETLLTRPALKQIDFQTSTVDLDFDMEQEFTKNPMVEEITFLSDCVLNVPGLKKIKKLFDALPNIKRVRVVTYDNKYYIENLLVFLKMIGDFKKLESLHFAIEGLKKFDVQKIQDLLNIVKDFPIKAKVVIADMSDFDDWNIDLKNVIEKKEAKPPKKVKKSQSRYPLFGSSFEPEHFMWNKFYYSLFLINNQE